MKEKLKACFEKLQGLDIQPTLGNMETLVQVLYWLREVYQELEEDENERGAEADPARRDGD